MKKLEILFPDNFRISEHEEEPGYLTWVYSKDGRDIIKLVPSEIKHGELLKEGSFVKPGEYYDIKYIMGITCNCVHESDVNRTLSEIIEDTPF